LICSGGPGTESRTDFYIECFFKMDFIEGKWSQKLKPLFIAISDRKLQLNLYNCHVEHIFMKPSVCPFFDNEAPSAVISHIFITIISLSYILLYKVSTSRAFPKIILLEY
jgi:hypothetical protein